MNLKSLSANKKFALVIIVISAALLIVNTFDIISTEYTHTKLAGPISNVLLILAMLTILLNKKAEK